jgi:hypothetical protein
MLASEPTPRTKPERTVWDRSGLTLSLFAAVALVASCVGRSISPALLGAATGLSSWIERTQHLASLLSQMVAAAGVAFTLRSVATTFAHTELGIGYRMLVIPAGLAASMLTMMAAGRALDPELSCELTIAALTAAAASAAIAMLSPATRALGFALALSAFAGACDLGGIRLAESAIENVSPVAYKTATILVTAGFAGEVLLVSLAFGWLAQRRGGRALLLTFLSFLLVMLWGLALRGAARPGASAWQVIVARAVTSWLRAPSPLVPPAARLMLEAAGTVATLGALVVSRGAPLAALFALCLLARGATDIPLPALLLLVAALAVPASLRLAAPPGGAPGIRRFTPEPHAPGFHLGGPDAPRSSNPSR